MTKKIYKTLLPVFFSITCISAAIAQSQVDSHLTTPSIPSGVQDAQAAQPSSNTSNYAADSVQENASSTTLNPYSTQSNLNQQPSNSQYK